MKILYLEDDPGVNRAISGLLRAKGHSVTSYHSARPALEHFEEVAPDVVVSDWHLEAGTAAAFIRRAAKQCPVVVFSGAPECVDRDILDLLNVSTLAKPSTAEVIFRYLDAAHAHGLLYGDLERGYARLSEGDLSLQARDDLRRSREFQEALIDVTVRSLREGNTTFAQMCLEGMVNAQKSG